MFVIQSEDECQIYCSTASPTQESFAADIHRDLL